MFVSVCALSDIKCGPHFLARREEVYRKYSYFTRLSGGYLFPHEPTCVTNYNMLNKPQCLRRSPTVHCKHRIHTHTYTKTQVFSILLSLTHTKTHTYKPTFMVGSDRELLTASTWPDRSFTSTLCVNERVSEKGQIERKEWKRLHGCVCECVYFRNIHINVFVWDDCQNYCILNSFLDSFICLWECEKLPVDVEVGLHWAVLSTTTLRKSQSSLS